MTLGKSLATYPMTWPCTTGDIVLWDISLQMSTMQGSDICCYEHFVVVGDTQSQEFVPNNPHDLL